LNEQVIRRDSVIVTPRDMAETPVSPLLYGHFIELGYGIQSEPMWGEMLFNRSFEPFMPYKWDNISWFDLWRDPADEAKGYETDWSRFDWYHSGYEHNAWFAAPGDAPSLRIDDHSTFIVERSPMRDVRIRLAEGAVHGTRCLSVENHEARAWAGVAQQGKVLRAGQVYRFRGQVRSQDKPLRPEVRFYPEGQWDQPIAVLPLAQVDEEFGERECVFVNDAFEGRATFSLFIPPQSSVLLDDFSLMPVDTAQGWRPDVLEAAKRVHPGVIRWPGGCFASFYDWRKGIGPASQRVPQPSYFWGGLNSNDVGTAELALFCQELGAEAMICVNLHHPGKREYDYLFGPHRHGYDFPEFTNLAEGARVAADWVAYCNAPVDHPLGALRAAHGYPRPFDVRFWEMDNEPLRWFEPKEYARCVVLYARAMKAVDPSIEIGLVTYGDGWKDAVPAMLTIAGQDVDFLSDRGHGEKHVDEMLEMLRAYNAAHDTAIRYCDTEWLAYEDAPDAYNNAHIEGYTRSFMFSKWRYAMNIARTLMMWQRKGGAVQFVNFNNFANTHAQSVIETPKDGVYLTAAGCVFELLSRSPAAWPLVLSGYEVDDGADRQIQAAWDRTRDRLVLYVFNLQGEPYEVAFDLSRLGRTFHTADWATLRADDLLVMNTLHHPDAIERTDRSEENLASAEHFVVSGRPYSFTQVVLR